MTRLEHLKALSHSVPCQTLDEITNLLGTVAELLPVDSTVTVHLSDDTKRCAVQGFLIKTDAYAINTLQSDGAARFKVLLFDCKNLKTYTVHPEQIIDINELGTNTAYRFPPGGRPAVPNV